MKFVFSFLFLTMSLNYAVADDAKSFTAISQSGYSMSCEDAQTNDNKFIQLGYAQNILSAQSAAKSKCELATHKLCAVLEWGGVMLQTDPANYPFTGGGACFGQATAVPIN